jgi:hypothetical protein
LPVKDMDQIIHSLEPTGFLQTGIFSQSRRGVRTACFVPAAEARKSCQPLSGLNLTGVPLGVRFSFSLLF